MKKFIFSKFAGLQANSRQLYYQMKSFTGIFDSILSSPRVLTESPHQILKSPPPSQWGRESSTQCSQHLWETLYTDVKITYNNTRMIHIMVSFSDYQNSIFIDMVPYKHKNWQLYGVLQISVQISMFSPHIQKVVFSA